jgi:hypothetical protein
MPKLGYLPVKFSDDNSLCGLAFRSRGPEHSVDRILRGPEDRLKVT